MSFDPHAWANKYKENSRRSTENQLMDSGWSARVAETCCQTTAGLLLELVQELASVRVEPSDIFDRPELARVLAAIHEVGFERRMPS